MRLKLAGDSWVRNRGQHGLKECLQRKLEGWPPIFHGSQSEEQMSMGCKDLDGGPVLLEPPKSGIKVQGEEEEKEEEKKKHDIAAKTKGNQRTRLFITAP